MNPRSGFLSMPYVQVLETLVEAKIFDKRQRGAGKPVRQDLAEKFRGRIEAIRDRGEAMINIGGMIAAFSFLFLFFGGITALAGLDAGEGSLRMINLPSYVERDSRKETGYSYAGTASNYFKASEELVRECKDELDCKLQENGLIYMRPQLVMLQADGWEAHQTSFVNDVNYLEKHQDDLGFQMDPKTFGELVKRRDHLVPGKSTSPRPISSEFLKLSAGALSLAFILGLLIAGTGWLFRMRARQIKALIQRG